MDAPLSALVALARAGRPKLDGTTLRIETALTPAARDHLRLMDEAWECSLEDADGTLRQWSSARDMPVCTVVVPGLVGETRVVVINVASLAEYNNGRFLVEEPTSWFSINDDYASGDARVPEDVDRYRRTIVAASLLCDLADVVQGNHRPDFVFLGSRKLTVPIRYGAAELKFAPPLEALQAFSVQLGLDLHRESRREIAKRVLLRFLERMPAELRFAQFLRSFADIVHAFQGDFDTFAASFSFDKAREKFERKRFDFIARMHAAGADAMGKLLAIPVAQGLLASQIRTEPASPWANEALLAASILFSLLGIASLINQWELLGQIKNELGEEVTVVEQRLPILHGKLRHQLDALNRRLFLFRWIIPGTLLALLILSTGITAMVYGAASRAAG